MRSLFTDLRLAVRSARRMGGHGLAAVTTLAVGIAATTSVASLAYGVLLRPPPFPDPDRLVIVSAIRQTPAAGTARQRWSFDQIAAIKRAATSFDELAAFGSAASVSVVAGTHVPEQISAEIVSPNYFAMLRAAPEAGQTFPAGDDRAASPVTVVSAIAWRRWFQSEPFTSGRTIRVNSVTMTVAGVLPDGFRGLGGRAEVWIPIGMAPELTYREFLTSPQQFISLAGRLEPGISLESANAELGAIARTLTFPSSPDDPMTWSASARPIAEARVDPAQARSAWLLLAAVIGVLLVACLNVTTVLLMRARLRGGELAMRIALGASRTRVVAQTLVEVVVLVSAAAAIALLLSIWAISWLRWIWLDPQAAHTGYVQLDPFSAPRFEAATFLWALLLVFGCTLATGLGPALYATRASMSPLLGAGSRSTTSSRRALKWLAGGEVAVAVILLAGTFVLLATFRNLQQTRTGFDSDHVMTVWVTPPASKYAPESGPAILAQLLERLERVPGVESVALNRCTPFGPSCSRTGLYLQGQRLDPVPAIGRHYVSPRYFETLRIPLISGRRLNDEDRIGRPPVTVVNQAAARRFWPGQNPVGRKVWFSSATGFTDPARPVEVVGVVGDVKYWPIDEPPGPDFYTSYRQFAYPDSVFVIRAGADPFTLLPSLRQAVAQVDPDLPIWDVRLLDDVVAGALQRPRTNVAVAGIFSAVVVGLAAFGIFAVMASVVAARRRELAIRIALGSSPGALRGLVLRESSLIGILGSAAGAVAAVMLLRLIRGFLYGVESGDPVWLGAAVALMVAVAVAAALVPAVRASRTRSVEVLRHE